MVERMTITDNSNIDNCYHNNNDTNNDSIDTNSHTNNHNNDTNNDNNGTNYHNTHHSNSNPKRLPYLNTSASLFLLARNPLMMA